MTKKVFIVVMALLGFNPTAHALESGASFLKIGSDAKAVSMGSAYTALAAGVSSMFYNTSGLAAVKGLELGFSHTNWLMDSMHDSIGIAMPLKTLGREAHQNGWTAGLGIIRLTNGSTETRNADRSAGNNFSSYDQSISVGFARAFGRANFGLGIKYLESSIAGEKARAAAVDLGFSRALKMRLPVSLGVSVQNLGTSMKYITQKDPLPLSVAAGFSFSIIPGFSMAFDTKRMVYDKQTVISLGTEYAVLSGFALRSGYLSSTNMSRSKGTGFSAGAGINLWKTQLDYAVTPYGEMGNTQRITLIKKF